MSQVPLAPPPPTGGPLDSWLYLLWRRLTQAGQILWASIEPGTSADVAAVVTDETGSPGSLVFSSNPTLTGCTVSGAAFTSRGITDNATATALTIDSTGAVFTGLTAATFANQVSIGNAGGTTNRFYMVHFRGATATPNNAMSFASSRGAEGVYTAVQNNDSLGEVIFGGANGSAWAFNKVAFTAYASENWTSTANGAHFAIWVTPVGTVSRQVAFTILNGGDTYLGGTVAAPALKVTPVASQARWVEVTGATSTGNPQLATTAGELLLPQNIVLPKTSGKGIQVDTAAPTFGWRDIIGQIGIKSIGATDPVWTLYRGSMYAYTFDTATAEAFMVFHVPHDYVPSSDMYAHVHWSQNVVDTGGTAGVPGVAEWKFDISYADGHGTAGGAADPFIAPITVTVTQQASTTQYGHMIAEVQFTNNGGTGGLIDSNTIQVDGLLLVRLYRVKANPADTLNQAPFVHTADIHYQSTNIGTKQKAPNFYT